MLNMIRGLVLGAILTAFVISAGIAVANAAECKGASKSSCERRASCTWVSGYVTKNKVKVSSYCRAASKKSKIRKKTSTAKKSSAKKSATKKSSSAKSKKKSTRKKTSKKKSTKKTEDTKTKSKKKKKSN